MPRLVTPFRFAASVLATLSVVAQGAALAQVSSEVGTNRPGNDYHVFDMSRPDPTACQAACDVDRKCLAYTYVNPGVQGPDAKCYLKTPAPASTANACCVSGVKSSASAALTTTTQTPAVVMRPPAGGVTVAPMADLAGAGVIAFEAVNPNAPPGAPFRLADDLMAAQAVNLGALMQSMRNPTFEAEAFGDHPELGLSVQEMSGFGAGWSGNAQLFWRPNRPMTWVRLPFRIEPGSYAVRIDMPQAPDYGTVDLSIVYRASAANFPGAGARNWVETQVVRFNGYAGRVQPAANPVSFAVAWSADDGVYVVMKSRDGKLAGIDRVRFTRR